ncbi:MAG: hypothetical protein II990_09295 [Muribaculaceae bacterium]|nr:hypothetical protein [Muribaculaceae bacterium]
MKKLLSLMLILIMCIANTSAATYLISSKATNSGATITHNGITFTVGSTAFADFTSFLGANIIANSTVYVASGTYSGDITVATEGLTFIGNNAFSDWTVTRAAESVITGTIKINASNVTINGFKFTEGGRIESTSGTNAAPLSGIKVLYNYFTGSMVKRSTSTPLVEIGNIIADANANTASSQCRYKNCEASHNHFEGDATHYANCISFGGAFGTTNVIDNYFYDGGTSVYFANAQGTLNIKNNVFKNVGKTTYSAPDGGNKGDFCIGLYRSGYANSTTANIVANEFDNCYGQTSLFPLIRVYQGNSGGTDQVKAVGYKININENTFKNKTTVLPSSSHNQAGEKLLLYNDKGTGGGIIFNLANNHYDNRFYKFAWVTLNDGQGIREIYANQFTRFDIGGKMSTFGTSTLTGTDVTNHATAVSLGAVTVIQSFDIDPVTGDMYFIQKMNSSRNTSYNSLYGLDSNHDGLTVTRVPCTNINGYAYTYSTAIQSMEIGYGGHGTNICFVRDKNGQGWLWSGGKATIKSGDDTSGATARWKFASGKDINLDGTGDTDSGVEYFNVSGSNDYPACDENSRYLCVRTSGSGINTYRIYDLDDALEGTKTLHKTVQLTKGEFAQSDISGDGGYNTWDFQSFDINGDYIYVLEGCSEENSNTITSGDPTLVITCYNWRTNEYCYRKRLNYGRINNLFGEPEGMVLRFDQYGHANLFVAVVNGPSGSRKANIYKYIIDYHTGYDDANAKATNQGDDTNTTGHFCSDYPAITFSCDTQELDFYAASLSETPSQTITITNGEYNYGQWHGVITGEDGDAFTVNTASNNAFSTSATATVTFTPKANKSTYRAYLRLFSPLASSSVESNDIVIPISATYSGGNTPATPVIKTSATNVSLSAEVGTEKSKDITLQGSALTNDIILSLSGLDADQFNLSTSSLSSAGGNVTITYNPSNSGIHSATLTASSNGAEDIEITITGTATDVPAIVTGYSLTQDWVQTSGHLTAGTNTRWATGFNGKIYINDHANSMLYYWTANGLTNTNIASAAGTAITSDDAGNIIVSTSMYAGGNTAMKVLPANGTAFQDLTLTMPDGVTANQMQYLGKAIGNIMSAEGGAIFIFPKDATAVAKIIIKNGVQTSATKIDVTAITADAQSIAIPLTNDINSNDIVARVRGANHFYYNNGSGFVAYPDNGINTTQGGTIFTLNGTLYNVQPIGSTAYLDGFQIVDVTNNTIVATHDAQFTTAAAAPNPNCITAEIVDTYEAKLYQYVPGQIAAQYTFSLRTSGIEDVTIDNEANMSVTFNGDILNIVGIDAASTALYSINGAMVAYDTDNTLNVSGLNGVYIVVAKTADGTPHTAKVIIK